MAKRNKAKFASKSRKSALRVEALEQRQLLAAVTGAGTEVGSNIQHSNGNVYDQVLMTGTSVTVTADWEQNQITRVSFLDQSGDIIQAEFSGKGTMTISLENFTAAAEPTNYNQDVEYVSGLATFTIQGSDATTNFNVFTVGTATAFLGAANPIFEGGLDGGNNIADVAALRIVADPQNPGGFSTFGRIGAGNAVFAADSGTVGITAIGVNVQGPVIIGDVDASNSGVPTLMFGAGSQFGTLTVAGGDLMQTNGSGITEGGFTTINSTAGTTSGGVTIRSQVIDPAAAASMPGVTVTTLDSSTTIDLTGKTQAEINDLFTGRTFTQAVTVSGDLALTQAITAAEFRNGVTFTGDVAGSVTVAKGISALTVTGDVSGAITATTIGAVSIGGDLSSVVSANTIGNVNVTGSLTGTGGFTTDADGDNAFDTSEGAIGTVTVGGNIADTAFIEGVLGIGNVNVTGNITSANAAQGGVLVTRSGTTGDAFLANIGTVTVTGDVDQGGTTTNLINIAGNGTFGNVTVSGTGTSTGTTQVGIINVTGTLGTAAASTGSVSITETASDLNWGGLTAGSAVGTVGAITITGAGTSSADFDLDGAFTVVGGATATGLTVSGFDTIDVDAVIDAKSAAVSLSTITGTAVTNAVTITVNEDIGATQALGAVTLNAGAVNSTVTFGTGDDITGPSLGDVTITGTTVSMVAGGGISTAGAAGAITINGALSTAATSIAITGTTASLTVTGATSIDDAAAISTGAVTGSVSYGATTTTADGALVHGNVGGSVTFGSLTLGGAGVQVTTGNITGGLTVTGVSTLGAGDINTGNITGALTLGGNATFGDGSQILVKGDLGSLVANGTLTMTANSQTSILLNNSTSATDVLGGITTAGRVLGSTGVGVVDIRASSIGDILMTGTLTQDQALIEDLSILAAPHADPNAATTALTPSLAETVSRDGSNFSSYKIGNVTIASNLDAAFTGTKIFNGENTFAALQIGNISITGDVAGAQQTRLFADNDDGAWFAAGDVDGLDTNNTAALGGATAGILRYDADTTDADTTTLTDFSAAPDFTGGTFSVGNVSINTAWSGATALDSGVLNVGGSAASSATVEGFAVLAGVVATAATEGDLVVPGVLAGTSVVNAADIDAQASGTVGSVFIQSNNAVASYDEVTVATLLGGADLYSGIIAATSVGTVQGQTATHGLNTAGEAVIVGDTNDTPDDDTIEAGADGSNQILVVVV